MHGRQNANDEEQNSVNTQNNLKDISYVHKSRVILYSGSERVKRWPATGGKKHKIAIKQTHFANNGNNTIDITFICNNIIMASFIIGRT